MRPGRSARTRTRRPPMMYHIRYQGSHPVFRMTRTWFTMIASTTIAMMTTAVNAPGVSLMSLATNLSTGIFSKTMFTKTPGQNAARYHTARSRGALENAGMVNRNARRQKAYATNNAGRKMPKPSSGPVGMPVVGNRG